MLSHATPDEDPTLSEEHGRLFVRRLHVSFWLVLGSVALIIVADLSVHSEALWTLLLLKLAVATVLCVLLAALRVPALRQRPTVIALFGVTVLCVATAIAGIVRNDVSMTGLVLMAIALGPAAVLPWGPWPQAATATIALVSMIVSSFMVTGRIEMSREYLPAGILVAFVVVVYVTYEFARYRRTLALRTLELRRSEAYFRSLIENSSELITVINADGTVRFDSQSHERVLGYAPAERTGVNSLELLHPDDTPKVIEAITGSAPGEVIRLEYRYRGKDGGWQFFEGVGTNLLHDPAVAGIVINSRDITERKRTEQALRDSEAEFRTLTEALPQIVWATGPDGDVTYINQRWMDYSGLTLAQSLGQGWTDAFHPDDQQRSLENWPRAQLSYRARHSGCASGRCRTFAPGAREPGG